MAHNRYSVVLRQLAMGKLKYEELSEKSIVKKVEALRRENGGAGGRSFADADVERLLAMQASFSQARPSDLPSGAKVFARLAGIFANRYAGLVRSAVVRTVPSLV